MWEGKGEKTHNNFVRNSFLTYMGILTASYLKSNWERKNFNDISFNLSAWYLPSQQNNSSKIRQ